MWFVFIYLAYACSLVTSSSSLIFLALSYCLAFLNKFSNAFGSETLYLYMQPAGCVMFI